MKKMFPRRTALVTGGCLAAATAWGQSNYATPYTFVTIAGNATSSGSANGTNSSAQFTYPEGVAVDAHGNLFVADNFANTIRKAAPVGTNWVVTTIAGQVGVYGSANGTNGVAQFSEPVGLAVDMHSNIFVADFGNNTVRKITPVGTNWVVKTIAGTAGNTGGADGTNGFAQFNGPAALAVDTHSNVFLADSLNHTIRKISPLGTNWVVTTIAGTAGNHGPADGSNGVAQFNQPSGIALDAAGNLFVADTYNSTIRKISPAGTNWVVTTIAGQAGNGGSADGVNLFAQFYESAGLAVDSADNLFVADTFNHTIRKLTPAGANWVVTTLAGTVQIPGSRDGTGASAQFKSPAGVAVDSAGNLFVADSGNATLRQGQFVTVPNLTISRAALAGVVVAWPNLGSYTLQTNPTLLATSWGNYGGAVTTLSGTNQITLPASSGNLFFRLTH